ncbi:MULTISPECIES: hypothetical protein [Streptomyces]|uniref:Sox C-terminal domain-containing protein n=2 Tax=Streptomyces TaxID=1883 RepID=A0A100Y184_9ACTN|nr:MULTISPECIES: hypothetical protein [Streptomyces]KUH35834.1 hypothetical protein ATE80_27000 [Streptomyces kanasensis]UUS31471.1 hypothetical protein NRO40_11930 [Streptomyces changanensis]
MYGPGPVPPQRPTAARVVVPRVLFAVLPLLSLGFLTGATTLRLAVVTRRTRDWWLFGVSVVASVTCLVFVPEDIETLQANLSVGGLLLNAALFTGYFLYADIRHHDPRRAHGAGRSPYGTTYPRTGHGYGYGHPQPQVLPQPGPYGGIPQTPGPLTAPPAHQPQHHRPQPQAPAQHTPHPQPQAPAHPQPQVHQQAHPQPQTAPHPQPQSAPPRIQQVRAELDELSDLLRREDGK